MKRFAALIAAVLSVLPVGCHYARGIGYVRERIPEGNPAFPSFAEGAPEGYWVWEDANGWHLRTAADSPHHFYGTIETLSGPAAEVRGVGRVAGGVRRDGDRIQFDYRAAGVKGFDWAGGPGCNRFELYIDGTTRPLRIFLGPVERSPPRVPFAYCTGEDPILTRRFSG